MWPGASVRVFLAAGATDMRKAINSLSVLVESQLDGKLFSGDLFVFCNRTQSIVKILYWDKSGFCLWQKKLEKEKFKWPKTEQEVMEIGARELKWLLEGLDIKQAHETLEYETCF